VMKGNSDKLLHFSDLFFVVKAIANEFPNEKSHHNTEKNIDDD